MRPIAQKHTEKWVHFKAQHYNALSDAFAQLLLSFSYLSPWWHIIKSSKNDLNLNKVTLTNYLGYDENQFVFIQFHSDKRRPKFGLKMSKSWPFLVRFCLNYRI